jgi:hypothetical protein
MRRQHNPAHEIPGLNEEPVPPRPDIDYVSETIAKSKAVYRARLAKAVRAKAKSGDVGDVLVPPEGAAMGRRDR